MRLTAAYNYCALRDWFSLLWPRDNRNACVERQGADCWFRTTASLARAQARQSSRQRLVAQVFSGSMNRSATGIFLGVSF